MCQVMFHMCHLRQRIRMELEADGGGRQGEGMRMRRTGIEPEMSLDPRQGHEANFPDIAGKAT